MKDIISMLGLFSLIAGPIIFIWGVIRSIFFGAVKIAGDISGGQNAVASGQKGYRRGTWLIVIGLILIAFGALTFWMA